MRSVLHFHDTSSLLTRWDKTQKIYVSSIVLEELEEIKVSARKDVETKAKARQIVRGLIDNPEAWDNRVFAQAVLDRVRKKNFLEEKNDHWLVCEALLLSREYQVKFYTADGCLFLLVKKEFPELEAIYTRGEGCEDWRGYRRIAPTQAEFAALGNSSNSGNIFQSVQNEYLIFQKDGKEEIIRWDGENYVQLGYKTVKNPYTGILKPLNTEQRIAFDLIQNPDIPIVSLVGQAGSGKTYLSFLNGLSAVLDGEYKRICYLRNNVNVADVPDVGAYPGSLDEKLGPFIQPLVDCVGSQLVIDDLIGQGLLEPLYLGTLKGRSLDDTFLLVDEGEDLTIPHTSLIVGRIGKNSKVVFCGDLDQEDNSACHIKGSGLANLSRKLRGKPLFGAVVLDEVERSEASKYASYLV